MESVSGMKWNHCPDSRGIGVQNRLEYAANEAFKRMGMKIRTVYP